MVFERDTNTAKSVIPIRTGLPQGEKSLFEWAVTANGMLYTAQIPVGADGAVVGGGIEAQAKKR